MHGKLSRHESSDRVRNNQSTRNECIIRLYADGHSLRAVGEMVGMSMANVRYVLKKAGVPRRRVGAPRKGRPASKLSRRDDGVAFV